MVIFQYGEKIEFMGIFTLFSNEEELFLYQKK